MSVIRGGRNSSRQIEEARGERSKGIQPMARSSRSGNAPGSRQPAQATAQQIHTIILEDDDDDVQDSSPRSFAQARSCGRATRQRNLSFEGTPASEDPLELRLGPTAFSTPPTLRRLRVNGTGRAQLPERPTLIPCRQARNVPLTIDLTSPTPSNDDCVLITETLAPQVSKRKRVPTLPAGANEQASQEPVKELRLTCPICMDVMREETSTVCGHIFCRACISGAIATQQKCPTCRRKLSSNKCTHRIYLSASLRNS
ncbi:E3 ubiquitin-protein ligase RNF4 [Marchantia polymorpha subsp. ruderalis]|uniref:RING-type domain-containing protein n=2 Tax=Marchantia polymorpha TaxID=3197 RepID=A0AAF6BEB2_MARPO|nr:hypothetical protein MARPO_0124s0044 [Marchantia polymorpha]BBN10346.1 hypothetical protein Mp_5g02790 [Marchantia polymorpha subsp. ruderalis]|eukprot:PTQ30472.1 hypothetical protein MARPO_0124s0044 [Marchantia polymorpha]